uniref:Uncharacterized protein n=1 Tax=Physcomitrium patens TaxID=3218 RepID=A0A2K1KGB6_PHYPA|nr:hypothetical protein PHYPA_009201 [Physcomitrium patens]
MRERDIVSKLCLAVDWCVCLGESSQMETSGLWFDGGERLFGVEDIYCTSSLYYSLLGVDVLQLLPPAAEYFDFICDHCFQASFTFL